MGDELIQDMSSLLSVLTQGEEQLSQLESNLNESTSITTLSKSLSQQLHSNLSKAISMARLIIDSESSRKPPSTASDSPRSTGGSPGSENSGRAFRELQFREKSKKRKSLPKWTNKVRVSIEGTVEGIPDDGYSWRKYGQKDILGAKFPRAYYRCTHRNSQGCLATKQVQKSEEDPSIFDITFIRAHTCLQKPRSITNSQPPQEVTTIEPIQISPPTPIDHKQSQTHPDHQLLISFKKDLQLKTECQGTETGVFSPQLPAASMAMDANFAASFSPAFFSSATSESNYLSMQPCNDLSELDSAVVVTSEAATSSSMLDNYNYNYIMELGEYEQYLPFDGSSLLDNLALV